MKKNYSLSTFFLISSLLMVSILYAETAQLPEDTKSSRLPGSPIEVISQSANVIARNLGQALGDYVRGKRTEIKQKGIVQDFDTAFNHFTQDLDLKSGEMEFLLRKVEDSYIKDANSEKPAFDQVTFRDLPYVIQKEYADIRFEKIENGTFNTYDYSGAVKTRWEIKNGKPNGDAITYYPNGEILYIDIYENGKKLNRKKYDPEGKLMFDQNYSYGTSFCKPPEEAPKALEKTTPINIESPASV